MKDPVDVFVPAHALAGAEGLGNPWNGSQRAESQFEGPWQICRALFICQRESLLFG